MTLIACWIKKHKFSSQLVIASDSMLSSGERWPCCPKLFRFDRQDCVICFSGNTAYTYPIILQIHSTINMNEKFQSRALDIHDLSGVIVKLANSMITQRTDAPSNGFSAPDCAFLFAGYSWKLNCFKAWKIYFNENKKLFKKLEIINDKNKKLFYFQGDNEKIATIETLKATKNHKKPLNMIPLSILIKNINSKKNEDSCIGGAPQLIIISKHMNSLPYNIYWPNKKNGKLTFWGRILNEDEKNKYLALDPETMLIYEYPFLKKSTQLIITEDNKKNLYILLIKILKNIAII